MKHEISNDRKTLTIIVDSDEQAELRQIPAGDERGCGAIIGMDSTMYNFLEPLIRNSELGWLDPGETGDLTDAPMLGILGEPNPMQTIREKTPKFHGLVPCGRDGKTSLYQPILERWAFMDYQVRGVLEELRDKGRVVFVS